MKKLISLALALTLALCMSVTAFATIDAGDNDIDVPATYNPGTVSIVGPDGTAATANVYSVKLEWTAIANLVYDGGNEAYYWDATAMEYKKHETASQKADWDNNQASCTITITNSSNAAIQATAAFAAAEDIGATVNCTFANNGCTVASAAPTQAQLEAGTVAGSAKTGTITASITASGALKSGVTTVGTITITIESV